MSCNDIMKTRLCLFDDYCLCEVIIGFLPCVILELFLGDIALDEEDVENIFGENADQVLDNIGRSPHSRWSKTTSTTSASQVSSNLPPFLRQPNMGNHNNTAMKRLNQSMRQFEVGHVRIRLIELILSFSLLIKTWLV